jgi:two-component system sensor histidine kinase MtrB
MQRGVFAPLLQVREAILRFGAGDRNARLPTDAPRELTEVAETFNGMADRIQGERRRRLEFLAAVAHDMSNPLMALKLSAGVARELPPDSEEKLRQLLTRVDRQVFRLQQMLGDLLDASRIEAGQLELRRGEIDLRQLVDESIGLYQPLPALHTLRVSMPDAPVAVDADETRITQVLNNLLSNAIKYSPEGGAISVALRIEERCAVLTVTDEGVGIAPDELTQVFEPFRRSRTVKDLIPGVGLGLSVVRRIVTAHGGAIHVWSTLGEGTTFEVRLPLAAHRTTAPALGPEPHHA